MLLYLFDFDFAILSILETMNFAAAADTGLAAARVDVDGGIFSSGSRAILRRMRARRISPCLTFQDVAASTRAGTLSRDAEQPPLEWVYVIGSLRAAAYVNQFTHTSGLAFWRIGTDSFEECLSSPGERAAVTGVV